jgi:hypothetical protein
MDDGKASSETRSGDAAKSFVFAEAEGACAEVEHRRVPGKEMEATVLDFGEVATSFAVSLRSAPMRRRAAESNSSSVCSRGSMIFRIAW